MAINMKKLKPNSKGKKSNDNKRRPNWLLRFTLLVIIVPLAILAWILLTSLETKGEPVVGDRFKDQLDPAISEEQLTSLEESFVSADIESVEVNLKSATLRVNINVLDSMNMEQVEAYVNDAYAKVEAVMPIATYFTNKKDGDKTIKMYDLEIHVYNYIPTDENREGYNYMVLTKNASAEDPVKNKPSQPIDQEVVNDVTNNPSEGEKAGQ